MGAALAAGVALGAHPSFSSLRQVVRVAATYEPRSEPAPVHDFVYRQYQDAYRRLRGLYHAFDRHAEAEPPRT